MRKWDFKRVSIQEGNSSIMGVEPSGRVNKERQKEVFSKIVSAIQGLGYSDIMSNPKHGTVNIPSATSKDKGPIRMALLSLERSMGDGFACSVEYIPSICSWNDRR